MLELAAVIATSVQRASVLALRGGLAEQNTHCPASLRNLSFGQSFLHSASRSALGLPSIGEPFGGGASPGLDELPRCGEPRRSGVGTAGGAGGAGRDDEADAAGGGGGGADGRGRL